MRQIVCIFSMLLFVAAANPPVGQRYALLIAVGTYPAGSGVEPLHADNDAGLFRQTLTREGFTLKNIRLLVDQQATRRAIGQAFDSLSRTLPVGSRIVVYFSGHGLQIRDDNHDEPDGLDEAILPYDGDSKRPSTLIRDDELGMYLTKLRFRVGPTGHVLLLFDSCHSGSILRDKPTDRQGRGIATSLPATTFLAPVGTSGWFENKASVPKTKLARYVLLAATTDGQSSFECTDARGKSYGPLTLAACRAWSVGANFQSYRSFFRVVREQMGQLAPYQVPTLEGDVDAPFLGR